MDIETIKKRIKALLQMTKGHGCTEEEAIAAAAKAAQLMAKYGIDETDVDMTEREQDVPVGDRSLRSLLWPVISSVTNTCIVFNQFDKKLQIYGQEPWTDVAAYLIDVCDHAILTEVQKFKKTPIYKRRRNTATRRQAVADFTYSLIERLLNKLCQLFAKTVSKKALAVAHEYAVKSNKRLKSIDIKKHNTKFDDAASAGWKAGGNVNISHGVNGAKEPEKIGQLS